MSVLERTFKLEQNGTNVKTEIVAGNAKKNDKPGGSKHVTLVIHTTKSTRMVYELQEPFLLATATSNAVNGKTQGLGTQALTCFVPTHV